MSSSAAAAAAATSTIDDEYRACQLAVWYPTFARPLLGRPKGVTLKSTIVPVPPTFLEFLNQDGVQLPMGTKISSCLGVTNRNNYADDDDDDVWSSDSDSDNRNNDDGPKQQSTSARKRIDLEDLTLRLEAEIEKLGGAVLPKTNWSAPRDAAWMNEGTLKCQTAGDVYLLLQSSDFVNSDVQLLLQQQQRQQQRKNENDEDDDDTTATTAAASDNLHIVLRKWCQLHASHEFRCFITNHRLVAISQRQTDQYFEHLVKDCDDVQFMIGEFFQEVVQEKYADGKITNYVMDVYIDRQDHVWIVDFNVWSSRTDSLLFTWDELNELATTTSSSRSGDNEEGEIRIIETAKEILPQSLNNYRAPVDTVNLAALTSASPDKFQAFMDLCELPSAIEDSSDDNSSQ